LEQTFGYEPYYCFVLNENGKIIGLLPLFRVESKLTGNRLCSAPFSHICGYIGEKDAFNAVISKVYSFYRYLKLDYMEIREAINEGDFQVKSTFFTYILELSPRPEVVWNKLKQNAKRNITKASKMGVRAELSSSIDSLRKFYELNCFNKKMLGVPGHPWKFFENLFHLLNKYIHLYISKQDGEIIGGGMMITFKDTVLYAYGASNPDYLKYYPYYAFIWKCIEDICQREYLYLDFGRVDGNNKGLIDFKKKWGTIEKPLYYSFYPKGSENLSIGQKRNSFKYRLASKVMGGMPMVIYKRLSDISFRHLG
jgi:hypothetical protein